MRPMPASRPERVRSSQRRHPRPHPSRSDAIQMSTATRVRSSTCRAEGTNSLASTLRNVSKRSPPITLLRVGRAVTADPTCSRNHAALRTRSPPDRHPLEQTRQRVASSLARASASAASGARPRPRKASAINRQAEDWALGSPVARDRPFLPRFSAYAVSLRLSNLAELDPQQGIVRLDPESTLDRARRHRVVSGRGLGVCLLN